MQPESRRAWKRWPKIVTGRKKSRGEGADGSFTTAFSGGGAEGKAETRTEGAVGARARAGKRAAGRAAGTGTKGGGGVEAEAKTGAEVRAEALAEGGVRAEALAESGVRAGTLAEGEAGARAEKNLDIVGGWRGIFPWATRSSRNEAGITRDESRFPGDQRLDSLWLGGLAACSESSLQIPAGVGVLRESGGEVSAER